jgi:hypothetical protein
MMGNKFLLCALILTCLVASSNANSIPPTTAQVTVQVKNHDNTAGVQDVQIRYGVSGPSYWFGPSPHKTDASGQITDNLTVGQTYRFYADYHNGQAVSAPLTIDSDPANNIVQFQTILLTLRLENCNGDPINGGTARYGAGSSYGTSHWPGGATGTSNQGETEAEVFPDTYSFEMKVNGTVEIKTSVDIPAANTTLTWTPTTVTLGHFSTIRYLGSGTSAWFKSSGGYGSASKELFPGSYNFEFKNYATYNLTISGCNFNAAVITLKLLDHNGSPITDGGGTARGGYSSSSFSWHVGSTDGSGILREFRQGNTNIAYEMTYNNTKFVLGPKDASLDPYYEFQTILLTLRLEDCPAGNPINGGHARYGRESVYTSWWFPGGTTGSGSNPSGETEAEFFPGTYSFEMQYAATADQKISVTIPDADTTLTWQTTTVILHHQYPIAYGGSTGDSAWFKHTSAPGTKELLPGTVMFNFRTTAPGVSEFRRPLTISGCTYDKTVAIAQIITPGHQPLPGFSGYHSATKTPWGPTDTSGLAMALINGCPTQATTLCVLLDQTATCLSQKADVDSIFTIVPQSTLTLSSSAGGSVITPGEGAFRYNYGETASFSAQADLSYEFSGWQGSYSSTVNPGQVTMTRDHHVRACFLSPLDLLYVDDDGPGDPAHTNTISDPQEDGTPEHPFDSIQEAIEVAKEGATILVLEGHYWEQIDFLGKTITITSFGPAGSGSPHDYPIIEGSAEKGTRHLVTFNNCQDQNTCLSGFVITGGYGEFAGGICCLQSNPMIQNCLIIGNRSRSLQGSGGAVYSMDSKPSLVNCTIYGNHGGANGAGIYSVNSDVVLLNSILYDNTPEEIVFDGNAPIVDYTDIAGGYLGTGNLDIDPQFILPGFWEHTSNPGMTAHPENSYAVWTTGDYHLKKGSPCIDAGDPGSAFDSEPEPNGGIINMGAYGGTNQATTSQ